MNAQGDFDRTISEWLDDQAGQGSPDYLDEVLARTERYRQRPAWTSLERWLPMQTTTRLAPVPRIAWLLVVLGLILALGATALYVGSRRVAPSPFGTAAIGTVLYGTSAGDIMALDSTTNESRPLIVGATLDTRPRFSPDGSRFAFERRNQGVPGVALMSAAADATDIQQLLSSDESASWVEWSPTSDRLAVVATINGLAGLWIVRADAEPSLVVRAKPTTPDGPGIDLITSPQWLPNGDLLFLGEPYDTVQSTTLYRVHADGNGLVPIVGPIAPGPRELAVSPDGTRVAYSIDDTNGTAIHVVDLDSGADRAIAFDGVTIARNPHWSPDGSRLVFERATGGTYRLAVGSEDGGPATNLGPDRAEGTGGADPAFLDDGTRIMAFYNADRSSWLLDASGGDGVQLDNEIATPVTWRAVAP